MKKQKLKRVKNYEEFVDGLDNKLTDQEKNWKDGIYVGKGSDRLDLYMEEPTNKTIDFSKEENDDLLWREDVVEDTDYSLQVLSKGACTVLFNKLFLDDNATLFESFIVLHKKTLDLYFVSINLLTRKNC